MIRGRESGQLVANGGLFTYATVRPAAQAASALSAVPASNDTVWKVVSHVRLDVASLGLGIFVARHAALYLGVLGLFAVLAYLLATIIIVGGLAVIVGVALWGTTTPGTPLTASALLEQQGGVMLLTALLAIALFSMAGVPPTVGFFAKLFVLEAVVSIDLVWLAAVAGFFSIIGAFYYIRAVKERMSGEVGDGAVPGEIADWVAWAEEQANKIDPLPQR